jgi:pimeloyl-ACP methyl ester carboxylesterase
MQIILAENDSLINSKIEARIKQLNPYIVCEVINKSGHAPFISKQAETIKIINEFINAKFN